MIPSPPYCPPLPARDLSDLRTVASDRFQSPRARKRAAALLLLAEGLDAAEVHRNSRVSPQAQAGLVRRYVAYGLQSAIFGSRLRPDQRRYNTSAVVALLRRKIAMRPPPGLLSWSLVALTDEVRLTVPGCETITRETVREVMKVELGIKSVRHLEPFWLMQLRHA